MGGNISMRTIIPIIMCFGKLIEHIKPNQFPRLFNDCEELCLDVDSDLITIGSIHREQVGAKILGYGTTHVEEV